MPQTATEILEAVRQLPPDQQRWIAYEILDPLDTEEEGTSEEIEAAWGEEIQRRLDEIDSGKVELIPWETVQQELHGKINALKQRR
jgi:putative addiction module component (TIGR02574 family)